MKPKTIREISAQELAAHLHIQAIATGATHKILIEATINLLALALTQASSWKNKERISIDLAKFQQKMCNRYIQSEQNKTET